MQMRTPNDFKSCVESLVREAKDVPAIGVGNITADLMNVAAQCLIQCDDKQFVRDALRSFVQECGEEVEDL